MIRASKELEFTFEHHLFGRTGKGLHEKISTAEGLPAKLVKDLRYVATIRNKFVHERGFDAIPDRNMFLNRFETSVQAQGQ